ncbi:MAG: sulfite exporter TauE/SafE family protein [Saprospiraceae bacterium]|nr:sulfite exporter TauE/SafE family protein [Saprospiraceae bacterium]
MKNYVGLFFTGVGIGIFLGLSDSPILLQILVPILTVIAGLLSILSGQKTNENSSGSGNLLDKNISPFPIMWLIIGMVAGAFTGLLAKNYDVTGNNSHKLVSSTSLVQNGSKEEMEHPKSSTVLHGMSVEFCEKYHLCELSGIELLCALKDIENPEIEEILSKKELNLDSIKLKINLSCNCQK